MTMSPPDLRQATRRSRPSACSKILMGVPSRGATHGGPALHLPMLVTDLVERGSDVVTFPFGRWSEDENLLQKVWHQAVDLWRFLRILHRENPALVHLNSAFDRRAIVRDICFVAIAKLFGKSVLIKWHGAELELLDAESGLAELLVLPLLHAVDAICVLSRAEAQALEQAGFGGRIFVVRNGLQIDLYKGRANVHETLGIPTQRRLLLFVARLISTKGLRDTLLAFPEVVRRHDIDLIVVGDGPERASCERLAHTLGIQTRVHFLGMQSEERVLDYYRGSDMLVFPTFHAEGFPMSIFQSVAAGLGVVTTRIRAAADYLSEPDHCLFVRAHDPADISRAVCQVLETPGLLERMQTNNRALAPRFDRKKIAEEFGEIHSQCMKTPELQ